MANKKISQLTAVTTLSNNDVFPVVQGTTTYKAKISDIKSYLPTASSLLTGLLSNTDWVTFNNKQNALTLGNLTESTSSVLTITGGTGAIIGSGLTIQVKQASGSQSGFLSSTDWTTFNSKMSSLTLTTTGTSGAATLVGSTLNIPQYLGSAITSLGGQTGATQTFSTDNTGTDFTISSVSNNHKFSIPNASGSARGLLTSTDFSTFSNKEDAVTWGSLTETTSSILTITGGSSAVRGNVTVAVKQVTALQDGYLGKGDYSTFLAKQDAITLTTTGSSGAATFINNVLNIPQYASGITSLNALTAGTQTFATGTSGTDFNISSSTSTHTFNIPDAGASARGVVTTGTQTLAGDKTFSSAPTFSTMTAGSVLFAGTSGLLSQDNTNLFWDNTNKRLGIGTNAPTQKLRVIGDGGFLHTTTLTTGSGGSLVTVLTISPTSTSSAGHRGFNSQNNHNAVGVNFTGFNTTAGWFENRPINAGTINELMGIYSTGLLLGSNSLTCGNVTRAIGAYVQAINQFNTNALVLNVVDAFGIVVQGPNRVTCTNTNYAAISINPQSAATNNTGLLLGTTSIPSGNWGIYQNDSANNYMNGKLFIGTTVDAGYKLDVNGTTRTQGDFTISDTKNVILGTTTGTKIGTATSQKLSFWNATPIVQPTTAVAAATRVGGGGTTVTDTDTFDGYTIAQIVKALRNIGLLA